jgi:hypothetical protein
LVPPPKLEEKEIIDTNAGKTDITEISNSKPISLLAGSKRPHGEQTTSALRSLMSECTLNSKKFAEKHHILFQKCQLWMCQSGMSSPGGISQDEVHQWMVKNASKLKLSGHITDEEHQQIIGNSPATESE